MVLSNSPESLLERAEPQEDGVRVCATGAGDRPKVQGAPDPSAQLEQEEEQQRVWRLLHELKPEHREILAMKYLNGQPYEEKAYVLAIPSGTVMSRLYAARKAFRQAHERSVKIAATEA